MKEEDMPGYATICQGVQDKLVSLFDLDDVDVDDDDAAQFLNNNFNTINLLLFVLCTKLFCCSQFVLPFVRSLRNTIEN